MLFVDPQRKSSTLGVTVSPVRVESLDAFGDLDSVAARLLQAEHAKVGTLHTHWDVNARPRQASEFGYLFSGDSQTAQSIAKTTVQQDLCLRGCRRAQRM